MAHGVDDLLRKLRDLRRAHDRLLRAVPDPHTAEITADKALDEVLNVLDSPEVASLLDEHIAAARHSISADDDRTIAELDACRDEVVRVEAKIAEKSGIRSSDLEDLYDLYTSIRELRHEFPRNVKEVRSALLTLHESTKVRVGASRSLARKPKKRMKRKIGQGIFSAVFGTALIAGNTKAPALMAVSYGIGGGALHQALRDLVGEPSE